MKFWRGGWRFLNREVKRGLTEKGPRSYTLKEVRGSGGEGLSVGMARAKALRWEYAWHVRGSAMSKMWLKQNKRKGQ